MSDSPATLPHTKLLTPQDVLAVPFKKKVRHISYGTGPSQFGELYLPKTKSPHPVVIVLHGGCWMTMATLNFMAPFCIDLASRGYAVWNLEYTRIGEEGGGWPGTFQDVADGIDHLRILEKEYALNLKNIVIVGHSSGGHLALWAAGRKNLNKESVLYQPNPLPIHGAVNIAGTGILKAFETMDEKVCGQKVISPLINGTHYEEGCPSHLLPLGAHQVLIGGTQDEAVPVSLMQKYEKLAKKAGDNIRFVEIKESGHFEFVVPGTPAHKNTVAEIEKVFK